MTTLAPPTDGLERIDGGDASPGLRRSLLLVGAAGTAAAALAIAGTGLPVSDGAALVGFAVVGAGVAGAAGWVAARGRRRSVRLLLVLAALAPVLATVLGAVVAASLMFLSGHDLRALLVVLCVSGGVGVATALVLSQRVLAGTTAVASLARALGEGEPVSRSDRLPAELGLVADELRAAAERLVAARDRQTAMEASRRELVAWVSHDLRTPLAAIRAMSEALEDGVVSDGETVDRYHRTIRQEADRLADLVDDLFELSRIQAGAVAIDPTPTVLADLVSDTIAGARPIADAKGVTLTGAAPEAGVLVAVSTAELARAVRNLVDNAIRHTPPGGLVEVRAAVVDGRAVVAVSDACGGIDEDVVDRAFDVAYRGDDARTPGDGRAGLGLAIAKGLVEAHHGSIAVANTGPGCTFTVELPLEVASV